MRGKAVEGDDEFQRESCKNCGGRDGFDFKLGHYPRAHGVLIC